MNKKHILLFVLLHLICTHLYTLNRYEPELVFKAPIGKKHGTLWVDKDHFPGEPLCFLVNKDIVISDLLNYRLVYFDMKFNFIKEIKNTAYDDTFIFFPENMKTDKNNNIYIIQSTYDFLKLNQNGERIYHIPIDKLGSDVKDGNQYFPIGEYIFYYHKNKVKAIDNEGNIIEKGYPLVQKMEGWLKGIDYDSSKQKEFEEYIITNNLILLDGILYNNSSHVHKNYYDFLRGISPKADLNHKINNFPIYGDLNFITYDLNKNSYWSIYRRNTPNISGIVVISQYGTFLDYFQNTLSYRTAVAPNGDVYFMQSKKDGTYFYKIPNTWDPITPESTMTKKDSPAQITNFPHSNFLTWKRDYYMYHPSRAFDGKPETGWLEASEGSGLGDYIGITLDKPITIDEIEIMPGYFDSRYYKDNNRVKSLTVKTEKKTFTLKFQDVMKPQKAKFKEPITFKEMKFIIKEIYKAEAWDDTAIAEIKFYYKGEEVKLDLTRVKEYLREVTEEEILVD